MRNSKKERMIFMAIDATLSFHKDNTWSIEHDLRKAKKLPSNVKPDKICDNIYWEGNMSIKEFYDKYFENSFAEWNKKEKSTRRCESYLDKIAKTEKEHKEQIRLLESSHAPYPEIAKHKRYTKTAYQIVITIGNCKDNPEFKAGGEREQDAKDILKEYMNSFEERNPGLKVVCGAIHCDESGNIHLHLTYCPVVECSRGQKVQNSLTKAMKLQGLESDKTKDPATGRFQTATEKWQIKERDFLAELCKERDINIFETGKSGKHLSVADYQREQDIKNLNHKIQENREIEHSIQLKQAAFEKLKSQSSDVDKQNLLEENIDLLERNTELEKREDKVRDFIADVWDEYKSQNAEYWQKYKEDKEELKKIMALAKQQKRYNEKILKELLESIHNRNTFFLFRLFRAIVSLVFRYKLNKAEQQLQKLTDINKQIKEKAKEVVDAGQHLSLSLKSKNLNSIMEKLDYWEYITDNIESEINDKITKDFQREERQKGNIEEQINRDYQ